MVYIKAFRGCVNRLSPGDRYQKCGLKRAPPVCGYFQLSSALTAVYKDGVLVQVLATARNGKSLRCQPLNSALIALSLSFHVDLHFLIDHSDVWYVFCSTSPSKRSASAPCFVFCSLYTRTALAAVSTILLQSQNAMAMYTYRI